jgi:hypothetical protein
VKREKGREKKTTENTEGRARRAQRKRGMGGEFSHERHKLISMERTQTGLKKVTVF